MATLGKNTNLRNFDPPAPSSDTNYMGAVKSVGSMPAVEAGTNDLDEYKTGKQPKDDLGGESKFN